MAEELDAVNKERQSLEREIFDQAVEIVDTTMKPKEEHILVIAHEGWHHGVIGIVASKLVERYYRPVIILAIEEGGIASGSARSVEGFSIFEALSANKALFNKFGGHDMAAGMSLDASLVNDLRKGLNAYAIKTMEEGVLIPKVKVDMGIDVSEITIEFIEKIQEMEPFGIGNREPSFIVKGGSVTESKKIGKDMTHLRIGFNKKLNGIGFGMGQADQWLSEGHKAQVVCTLDINEWRDKRNPQMMLKDIRLENHVYAKLRDLVDVVKSKEYEEWYKDIHVTRDDFTRTYRYLQFQASVKEMTIYYSKWMEKEGVKRVDGMRKYLMILEVFVELGLITASYDAFSFNFTISKGKRVDLDQSIVYNKLLS